MIPSNPHEEEFKPYYDLTMATVSGLLKNDMLQAVALESFRNFPDNIHHAVKAPIDKSFRYMLHERDCFTKNVKPEVPRDPEIQKGDTILNSYYSLQRLARHEPKKSIVNIGGMELLAHEVDFGQQLMKQNLVFTLAMFEAHLVETARLITGEVKQGTKWSRNAPSERITEISEILSEGFYLNPKLSDILDEANLLRNCIVHNGSRYSTDYIKYFGQRRGVLLLGDIKLTPAYLKATHYITLHSIKQIFIKATKTKWTENQIDIDIYGHHVPPMFGDSLEDTLLDEENHIHIYLKESGVFLPS